MVETEGDALAVHTHHAARVSCIGHEDLLSILVYNNHIGSATNRIKRQFFHVRGRLLFSLNRSLGGLFHSILQDLHEGRLGGRVFTLVASDLLHSFVALEHLVKPQEGQAETFEDVVTRRKLVLVFKHILVVSFCKSSYLLTAVAVKHSEKGLSLCEVRIGNVRVLHIEAPSLHVADCKSHFGVGSLLEVNFSVWLLEVDEACSHDDYTLIN